MARLVILTGSANATHELAEELITIGRAEDSVVRIGDPSVSGRHAQIELSGDACMLRDLGSTNGTFVNGQQISEHQLRGGDRIRFGRIDARFESDVTGEAQPLPELSEIAAETATSSARPADFANASPFPRKKETHDPTRLPVLAAAAVALLAFAASVIAVIRMSAPTL